MPLEERHRNGQDILFDQTQAFVYRSYCICPNLILLTAVVLRIGSNTHNSKDCRGKAFVDKNCIRWQLGIVYR